MQYLFWTCGFILFVPVAWCLVKVLLGKVVPPEKSGREYLKQKMRFYEIDTSLFPERALNEIVTNSLAAAKGMTAMATMMPEYGSWQTNFVNQLDGKAVEITEIMRGSKSSLATGETKNILLKYGVVKS